MRIDRLDLLAFGPFTDLSLDLSAPGVHLITGPNEAGKSTALRALDQLLYGIDMRSPYDFVHAKPSLRLGALLRGSDGDTLAIVRSKSRNTPLLGAGGSPLNQSVLQSFIGGIDQPTFTSVFALTSAELRRGGETLVSGGGDLAQALAASRSGLPISDTLRAITARMDELFKKTGSKPPINARLTSLKQARELIRAERLHPQRYLDLEREVEAARATLARIASDLTTARTEQSRLQRLRQALPALNRRRRLLDDIDAVLAEGALAPEEAAKRLPGLVEELGSTERVLAEIERRLGETRRELGQLAVDEDLLSQEFAIESLYQERKAAKEAAKRLAHSAGAAADLREEAESLLWQVHPDADLGDTRRYKAPKSVRTRAGELRDRRMAIDASLTQSRQALTTRSRRLENADKKLSGLPPIEDAGPLRAAVDAIPHNLLTDMVKADEEVKRSRSEAEQALLDLKLAALPVEDAGSVTVPSREQTEAHLNAVQELRRDRRQLATQRKLAKGQLEERRLELATLLSNDPPPTEADLASARSVRDELWQGIRDGLHANAEGFEHAVTQADSVADQMRRDAKRVSDRFRLELEILNGQQGLTELGEEELRLDGRAEDLNLDWGHLWTGFAGSPPRPDAATTTLDHAKRLRDSLGDLRDAHAGLAALREQAALHIARLRTELREPEGLSLGTLGDEKGLAELPELREIAETRLAHQAQAAQERMKLEDEVARAREEQETAATQVSGHELDLTAWESDWRKLLDQAALPVDRDTVSALADLDRLDQVAAKVAEAIKIDREADRATATIEQFQALLRTTASACGRAVPDDETEHNQFVGNLYSAVKLNRSIAERQNSLRMVEGELEADAGRLRASADQAGNEFAALRETAGVGSDDALRDAVQRRERHAKLDTSLAEVTETFSADTDTLHALMVEAEHTDPDLLEAELGTLADQVNDLETQRTAQSELFGKHKTELGMLDGSAAAAKAAAGAEVTAAALVEESEEYLRLWIARNILVECMEDYRQTHQDPILARASDLFRRLTLDRFSRLEIDQEGDSTVVLARRGADLLGVKQLSEGTADQLYLALRLASLERYAEEGRSLPFTVDDIFMTFDNDRTRAALGVLDEMADRFQMIVFTHHEHLTDLAREVLPDGRVHVHRLPGSAAAPGGSD